MLIYVAIVTTILMAFFAAMVVIGGKETISYVPEIERLKKEVEKLKAENVGLIEQIRQRDEEEATEERDA